MYNIRALVKLFRLDRALSASFGVIFTGLFVGDLVGFQPEFLVAFLVVLFSALANFGFNDYCDLEVDRSNHRHDRPLVQGSLTKETVLLMTAASTLLALVLALLLNPHTRLLVIVGLPVSLFYHIRVKSVFLLKNAFIGLTNVGIVLLGSLISDTVVEPVAIYIAAIGFFVGFSYEIMLDIADVQGDSAHGIDTIPARFGVKTASWVSVVLGLGAVVVDPLPYFVMVDPRLHGDTLFLLLILVPVILRLSISFSLYRDQSRENVLRLKKRAFRNLQLGCLCFMVGILY
ncbi:MAG: UbiA family prenyltransferase [Candidatus Bathyarchaeota archaeon]|nr:MAG: UbiA family prenyltransferase [Candidatus Bathyarchaeota archaeon]